MLNKKNIKLTKRLLSIGIILISIIPLIFLVSALTSEPEIELNDLVSNLEGSGYGWLVDYNINYPNVEVYEQNKSEVIATFEKISSEDWYKVYLTNLSPRDDSPRDDTAVPSGEPNRTQDVFDLKILGGIVEFDYIVDPIILGNANSLNTNTTYENNFTHLNVSNSSIVGYWSFDDNVSASTVYDYTNNSNDGTITGGAVYNTSQAIYGGAMTFDGKNDYLNITPAPASLNSAKITWSAWVKVPTESAMNLMEKVNSSDTTQHFGLWLGDGVTATLTNELITILRTGVDARIGYTTATRTELFDGNWHHIVLTADGTTYKIYLDGVSKTLSVGQGSNNGLTTITGYNQFTIGSYRGSSSFVNGSIDEVMIWNTALNSTEVLAIYNNQTQRFFPTGEMNFTGVNFAGNDTINITLADCQQNMGSLLRAKVNNGAYVNFDSNCFIQDYNASGNLNSANVTVGFISDANRFYTPLVLGNISLDSRDLIVPNLTINLPANNSFSSQTNLSINYTAQSQDLNTCWYSNDTYTANTTLANCGNITTVQWAEGQHNLTIWVNDTANSLNSSMVTFTIDTTFPTISYDSQTPTDNSSISTSSLYVNVSVADSNFENMSYYLYNESLNVSGLVGYWNFDRNTTLVRDLSGQRNSGTRVGGVNWTTGGKLGEGFSFDGSNDEIRIPDHVSLRTTTPSVSAWIKTSGTNDYSGIFKKFSSNTGYQLSINTLGNIRFDLGQTSSYFATISSGVNVEDNAWHNIVATYNGTTTYIYIDGVQRGTANGTGGAVTNTYAPKIGNDDDAGNRYFNGNIDEPMIFNKALSATDVSELYNRGLVNHTTYSTITESINWTGLVDNDYNYFADVIDKAENYNSTLLRNVEVDTTFPTLSFASPTTNTSNLSQNFIQANLSFTETNLNVTNISLYNSTQNIINSTTGTSSPVYINFSSLADGRYYLNATISDLAGNRNQTETRTIILDTTFPTLSFANPTTNTSNLSQNFIQANLSFTETNLNVTNITLYNSTQNIINSTTGTTSPVYINFSGLSDGRYYLNATISDTAGNKNQTETRIIGLDRVAPNLTINSPTATTYTTSTILFNATSIDLTTLVDSCWYTTNSGTTNQTLSRAGASNGLTNFYNFTQTSIADSTYTARFYCNDSANNVNNTQNVAFTIDTSVPAGGGPAPITAGGAGGGAPSKPVKKRIFNLGYNMYDQTISLNQVEFDILQITNNGEFADEYNIEIKTIDNIISFEKKKIKLEPGESKAVEFKISSPKEPGIYPGKIIVSNGVSEREVLITINVKTEKSLFDITLTIPESLKTLLTGQNLISKIDLIQMGLKENIDITLNYLIKDFEGQTYLSESETIAVLDQKSYEKEFFTGELPPGQYILGTELIHPDGVAVSSTHFVVQAKGVKYGKEEILLSSLILALVLVSAAIFLAIRRYKRIEKALREKKNR